jgi:hypothetical protein
MAVQLAGFRGSNCCRICRRLTTAKAFGLATADAALPPEEVIDVAFCEGFRMPAR